MPRAARPEKHDWASTTRMRPSIRKKLKRIALELGIPAEEVADYILSNGLGEIPFRHMVLPGHQRASGAA